MTCPNCENKLYWDCDYDYEDSEVTTKTGDIAVILSCWSCSNCNTTVSIPV